MGMLVYNTNASDILNPTASDILLVLHPSDIFLVLLTYS